MDGVTSDNDIYSINALARGDRPAIVTLDFSLFSSGPTVGSLLAGANCDHPVLGVNAVSDMASSMEYFPLAALASSLQLPVPGHPEHSLPSARDLRSLLSEFDLALRAAPAAMCDSEELNEEERAIFLSELADMYRAWLGFLLATAAVGPVRPTGSLHIIAGGNGSRVLPQALSTDQIITLPVADVDLLGSADLACSDLRTARRVSAHARLIIGGNDSNHRCRLADAGPRGCK